MAGVSAPPLPPGLARNGGSDDASVCYEAWTRIGGDAMRRGEFREALEAYVIARQWAELGDDPAHEDAADLNVARARIETGEARRGEDGLREILLRTSDLRLAWHAAYHLASSLRKQGRYERALTYAQRAMEKAAALEAQDLIAPTHNLLGNILLNESHLEQALAEYRTSLAIREASDADVRWPRAILQENIGYCLLLLRRFDEGRGRIEEALSLAEEVGDRRCRAECLQDLCYADLLEGRYEQALDHGRRALEDAETAGYSDIEENCHYLMGEIGSRTGDLDSRDLHFSRLQANHPELPFLKDFLCAVDVTGIITLKR